jgi:hypothetical protein
MARVICPGGVVAAAVWDLLVSMRCSEYCAVARLDPNAAAREQSTVHH